MKNLRYSIHINASREKVWDAMLSDATYREWTAAFMPGSYFEGDWSEGSVMRFLAKDPETGKAGGMVSRVKENRSQEFISLEHYAELHDDVEQPWPESGFENYTFAETEGGTDVTVDMLNVPDEYAGMFDDSWPKSLEKLKEIAEK
jgi:uncharacterized protein YndB with AHSA1/START domain